MKESQVRTRFAPSPTGMMHIGNLRSALYEYLVAKSQDGVFVLRLEDTDRKRYIAGAENVIYQTLATVGLQHDEGPDVGGPYAPYIQSERVDKYLPYAQQLIDLGHAYYDFSERTEETETAEGEIGPEQSRRFRDMPTEEIDANLAAGKPYVIRQRMPLTGSTEFQDLVFGTISVENKELEDQILIKSDGYPTYNFANVIDDHEMNITHVVRGSEYLSSTPKYNLLYQAFGWEIPTYIHLPLINGTDGKKLSKRHGATSFEQLVAEGYLPEAITNYIAFLGWAPGADTREIFSLEELVKIFDVSGIGKAPAVFDYAKLDWYNQQYLLQYEPDKFCKLIEPAIAEIFGGRYYDLSVLGEVLQTRICKITELKDKLQFAVERGQMSAELFTHKKSKLTPALCLRVLEHCYRDLFDNELAAQGETFDREQLHNYLMGLGTELELKTGQIMGPVRLAVARQQVTPGGATELLLILGRAEVKERIVEAIRFLNELQGANNE